MAEDARISSRYCIGSLWMGVLLGSFFLSGGLWRMAYVVSEGLGKVVMANNCSGDDWRRMGRGWEMVLDEALEPGEVFI